ncbi:MAG: acyltransferase family protein [Bacteroidetes bacterium]|nr:acyltransferase family protein [Bacteroidota bacterium]
MRNTHTQPSAPNRLRAVDLARGLAAALMVATHVTDAFLTGGWKQNEVWYQINILFGFVAPAFALLSGVTLGITLARHAHDAGGRVRVPRATWQRLVVVLLLGYWLQVPVLSIRQLIYNQRPFELARMFDANILQIIALVSMGLAGLVILFRSVPAARLAALLLGIAFAAATPYVWHGSFQASLPLPVRLYLSPTPPATFGLFPAACYLFFGFAASGVIARAGTDRRLQWTLVAAGLMLVVLCPLVTPLLESFPPNNNFWAPSIQYVFFRTGGVFLLVGAMFAAARYLPQHRTWLEWAGSRSLAIYVLHLMVVYGSPMTMGMRWWFNAILNGALGPWLVGLFIAAMLAACTVAIRFWDRLRTDRPALALWGKRLWWAAFWGIFLLNP